MKIIAKDNYDRENRSDILVAENVSEYWAEYIKKALNSLMGYQSELFIDAVPDDYKLYKFEP